MKWVLMMPLTLIQPRAISSTTRAQVSSDSPRPPYSSGIIRPKIPISFMPSTMSVGYSSLCSSSVATGMICSSTNSRTSLISSCCSSVRPSVVWSRDTRDRRLRLGSGSASRVCRRAAGRWTRHGWESSHPAESMWRRHGDLVHMVVGPPGASRDVWWLHHPDGAARVLSGSSWRAYAKRDQVHDEIARWLGPGLLTAEGEDWTRQKRFVQPVFTKVAVEGYADLMVEEIVAVVGEWDVSDQPTVDLGAQMQGLTLRVVLKALFGDSADDVVPHVRESFPAVSDTIMRRGLGALRLPAGIPTRRVRRGRAAREDLFGVCEDIVAGRREGRTTGETDLLSRLIAARDGEERLSDEAVRGQVLVFMLAGHETTSTALTFALHLLGRHQDVQDRVRAEVREVVGDRHPTAR